MTLVEQHPQLDMLEKTRTKKANQELLDYCNRSLSICKSERVPFERQWYTNLSFYFGRQWVQWVGSALDAGGITTESSFNRLYEPAIPPWRVRLVINKVRAIVRGELSKVIKEHPRGFVIPASTDDEDRAAARAADSLVDYLFRDRKIAKVERRSQFWNMLCGTSYIKDWYDPTAPDSSGQMGSIMCEPVSTFHLYAPDIQEEEIESQPFVIHVLAKSPEWIRDNFKVNVQADAAGVGGVLESKFLSALGINSSGMNKRYVSVKELWVKPCGKYPQGAQIVCAGDQVLGMTEEWPYQHGEYPFTKFDHIPTGRFYGDSTIVDLIPVQREFNRTRSQLIESKNRMSKPQLMAPRGSVDPKKITSEPGLIVFYTPGFAPPQPIPLQAIPSYVTEELTRLESDMMDISSQHEITKGSVPPGVTAATAISFLQEQDDSKLSPTISSLEEGVEKIGRHFLNHVAQFWNAQRQIQVIGANGQFEAYMFNKSNIRGNTDFKVEAGSATPTSRAAKQAFIMELVQLGVLPPDKALRYLNMAETGKLYEEMMQDARQAQRENLRMSMGEELPINSWDNDQIHVEEHDNYRKTQEFERLPDQIKVMFETHVSSHKQHYATSQGITLGPGDPKLDMIIKGIMPPPAPDPTGAPGNQPALPVGSGAQ